VPTTRDPSLTASGPPLRGVAIVIASASLFGMLGVLSRSAYDGGMEPAAFVAWRAGIGLVVIALALAIRTRRGQATFVAPWRLPGRMGAALALAAVMGLLLNLCMFFAFDRITVALALLGFYTYPAMVAVANAILGRESLDGTRVAALILASLGMAAVVASQLDPAAGIRLDAIGIGLALGAAVSQTVYVIVSRDGYPAVPTDQAIGWVLAVSTVGAIVTATIVDGAGSLIQPLASPDLLPLLVFTGVFAAAIPSLGFLTGIRAIGGVRAGILMLFEPVVGVALAAWLLDEALAPIQVVGAVAILAAAVLLQRAPRRVAADQAIVAAPGGP
jgi:drug/metabolite transporter (DMT)-like permease